MNDKTSVSNSVATTASVVESSSIQSNPPVATSAGGLFSLFSIKEITAGVFIVALAWLYVQQYGYLIPSLGFPATNRIYVVDDAKLMQALLKDVLAHADVTAPEKTESIMRSRMIEIQNKIIDMEQGGMILLKKSSVMISGNKADITESIAKSLNLTLSTAEQNSMAQQKSEEMILSNMTKARASNASASTPIAAPVGEDKGPGSAVN